VTEWSQVPAVARPLPSPEPQPLLAPLTAAAIFLVLTIEPGGEDAVRDLLADRAGLQRAVGFRVPEAPLACVAGIGSGAFAGGSYVIVQKYLHDLAAWNALSTEDQEKVIGRTKLSDIEMPDGIKLASSTISRIRPDLLVPMVPLVRLSLPVLPARRIPLANRTPARWASAA
jgi:deferrochelatase/peroxidase EfeB